MVLQFAFETSDDEWVERYVKPDSDRTSPDVGLPAQCRCDRPLTVRDEEDEPLRCVRCGRWTT